MTHRQTRIPSGPGFFFSTGGIGKIPFRGRGEAGIAPQFCAMDLKRLSELSADEGGTLTRIDAAGGMMALMEMGCTVERTQVRHIAPLEIRWRCPPEATWSPCAGAGRPDGQRLSAANATHAPRYANKVIRRPDEAHFHPRVLPDDGDGQALHRQHVEHDEREGCGGIENGQSGARIDFRPKRS